MFLDYTLTAIGKGSDAHHTTPRLDTQDTLRFIKYPSFSQESSSLFYKELYNLKSFNIKSTCSFNKISKLIKSSKITLRLSCVATRFFYRPLV